MTPEGKVKAAINKVVDVYVKSGDVYKFMPVPGGFGPSSLDYILCVQGKFVAIEAKRPGGKATARQHFIARQIKQAGGMVFFIENDVDLSYFIEFLNWLLEKPRPSYAIAEWAT
jgi:hypothetical protein